jgi:hypothetical protein
MARLPDDIRDFMKAHGVREDEVWPVPGGKAFAVKHKALERIAADKGISFDPPQIIEANGPEKCAALCVTGRINGRAEWSIGEAAPANNKNQYPFAMAEKRAKDRVILKLLSTGAALYSEDEADDFRQPPATTAAATSADSKRLWITTAETVINAATDADELAAWWRSDEQMKQRRDFLDQSDTDALKRKLIAKADALKAKVPA